MPELYLPIFPQGSLAQSVITTIWIGVAVIAFFNLRFGWVLSGLIVPGYLTPMLIIKPLSVAIVIFESILTYLLVYLLSEVAARYHLWTNFFGRDRFFVLLLFSIAVRLSFDGYLLPWTGAYLQNEYDIVFDYKDNFHSFGLIIVALMANQFWKPGLIRGLFHFTVTLAITYAITRFILIEYTNFSMSNIAYMYEDIATSILAGPKSYIILIFTALIASRMNLFYGWDFNGILVPSLLALQWYQPTKIVTSFFEAYVILAIAKLILQLPMFQNTNVEGARKILLFFQIGFIYKFILSYFIIHYFPGHKVSDFFAFGYLLSTLIAIKMYDKVNMALFTRVTVQTSVFSVIAATFIGFALTLTPDTSLFHDVPRKPDSTTTLQTSDQPLLQYVNNQKIHLYGGSPTHIQYPTIAELESFSYLLELIDEDFEGNQDLIAHLLSKLHYQMTLIQQRYLVLIQRKKQLSWGAYIIDLSQNSDLTLEITHPLQQTGVIESAIVLMKLIDAKALGISGITVNPGKNSAGFGINHYDTLFHTFHKHYARNSVMQIRALTTAMQRRFAAADENPADAKLFVKGAFPKQLNLQVLKRHLQNLTVHWDDMTPESIQKESMRNGFSELFLNADERRALIATQLYFNQRKLRHEASFNSVEGLLRVWLLNNKIDIAAKGSERYIPPVLQELLFLDYEIFSPILALQPKWGSDRRLNDTLKKEMNSIAFAAHAIGYRLILYTDNTLHRDYLIMVEETADAKRYWGTFVFKLGSSEPIMIQVPRPLSESNSFEYSLELFDRLNAKALSINGAHPSSNADLSADVMLLNNKQNVFNLFSQVLYRESKEQAMSALQIRGKKQLEEDVGSLSVLAFNNGAHTIKDFTDRQMRLYSMLKQYIPITLANGSVFTAGYDARAIQALYLNQSVHNDFATLWLPYGMRKQYRQLGETDLLLQQFQDLGIPILTQRFEMAVKAMTSVAATPDHTILERFTHYLRSHDVTELNALKNRASLKLLIDQRSNQPFLLLLDRHNALIAIGRLNALPPFRTFDLPKDQPPYQPLIDFYHQSEAVAKVAL